VVYHRVAAWGLPHVSSTWSQDGKSWTARIQRAKQLAEGNPWASQVLNFYLHVLAFQRVIYDNFVLSEKADHTGFRATLDSTKAASDLPELAAMVSRHGPPVLAKQAEQLQNSSRVNNRNLIEQWLFDDESSDSGTAFFARVLLQPQAERLAESNIFAPQKLAENRCPHCGSVPQLAVLRPEGDGAKRILLCSLCNSEWEFRRVLCPACGERDHEKLPRYTAADIAAVRIEACDTCHCYLKSIDLTVDGLAVPIVDEIAAAPLDLWAAAHNYHKIQVNLVGF